MKKKPFRCLFGLTTLVIYLLDGCRPAAPPPQVSQTASPGMGHLESAEARQPVQDINTSADVPAGELVYLVNTLPPHSRPQRITYNLILRHTGPDNSAHDVETHFPLIADYVTDLYSCQFSPNGQFVSLKEGLPGDQASTYQILLWNRKTSHLRKVPDKRICYPHMAWSPDSRKIAYIQGGDVDGDESFTSGSMAIQLGPIDLCVYDLRRGKSRRLARLDQARDFAWLSPDSLLYIPEDKLGEIPNIYQISVHGGPSKKVIAGGFQAAPSPSGRWIAFLSQTAQTSFTADNLPVGPTGLYLYDTQRKTRRLVHALKPGDTPDVLLWSPDSRRLWSIQNAYRDTRGPFISGSDTKDHPGYGAGHFTEIAVPSLTQRTIAVLKTTDDRSRDDPASQFQWKGLSHDGRFLLVEVNEIGSTTPDGSANYLTRRLCAVSLRDGSVQTLWTAGSADGLDWREAPPTPKAKRQD